MRKHLIIAGIICAASIPPATAVTKCVALGSNTTCSNNSGLTGTTNWSATCKTSNGPSVPILGIGVCSNREGSDADTSAALNTSEDVTTHTHCWCRMTSPAVSDWVFAYTFYNANDCAWQCAFYCAHSSLAASGAFRAAIFSNLSD